MMKHTVDQPERPCWVEVDSRALENNVQQIRQQIGEECKLCGVVKANAYGHGAVPVTKTLIDLGVNRFAVATLGEALELRDAGIDASILVLGYNPVRHAAVAVEMSITLTVYDLDIVRALSHAAQEQGRVALVHIKVNTGMNRLGLRPNDVAEYIRRLNELPAVEVEGLYTHFATSDMDRKYTALQFERFSDLIDDLTEIGLRPPVCHAGNSAAMLVMRETNLDMVRCGIALYGLDPHEAETPIPKSFQPVLSWKAEIAQVTQLEPGEGVSYGLKFVAEKPSDVAVIPVGYADGFPLGPLDWQNVLVHGLPAPIAGRVCMDQTILDVTEIVRAGIDVRQGDEVVLIGRQGNAEISAEEAARRIGTINYDVVSRILSRVPRRLI